MTRNEKDLIEIDGSYGEGGGQILRTALSLSTILNEPLKVCRIRAGRKKPGLQPQHLKAAESLVRMTGGRLTGATIGSETITFVPQELVPGDCRIDMGTAGSVTLLLQAVLPPMCLAKGSSRIILTGGTHVPWSPPFHYLQRILFPVLEKMGVNAKASLRKWGWYPKGGGVMEVEVHPVSEIKPIALMERGPVKRIRGLSASSNLPTHISERQKEEAVKRIRTELNLEAEIEIESSAPAIGAGSFVFLTAETDQGRGGFSSLGKRGKRAEEVAADAVDELRDYLLSDACLDPHLSDQVVLFMGLAKGVSSFTTSRITEHLLTNLWVMRQFLDVRFTLTGELGRRGKVEISRE